MGRTVKVNGDRPVPQNQWPPSQELILVGLIEDHPLLRERLADLMGGQPGLHLVASAAATTGGLERLQQARPQVVVIGSAANGTMRHHWLQRVKQGLPEARVVVMHVSAKQEDVILLIEEGASGLLLQEATVDEFLRTIRLVSGGTNVVPDPLVPLLFSHLADRQPGRPAAGVGSTDDRLTRREWDVCLLIAGGLNNQGIADHLGISLHTVKTHVSTILRKLDLRSRLQIAVHIDRQQGSPASSITSTRGAVLSHSSPA